MQKVLHLTMDLLNVISQYKLDNKVALLITVQIIPQKFALVYTAKLSAKMIQTNLCFHFHTKFCSLFSCSYCR